MVTAEDRYSSRSRRTVLETGARRVTNLFGPFPLVIRRLWDTEDVVSLVDSKVIEGMIFPGEPTSTPPSCSPSCPSDFLQRPHCVQCHDLLMKIFLWIRTSPRWRGI
ncbi:hypothetical protein PoB_004076900 [Plakobranchus ocellatus]|uniref:Uncharacterized protein n=1 Tax=Plakobranchus ocellatus TaxID=259542 RepID=A0AAV4B7D8_9GAST|nr:hypothetical protein PoB_004076900 [Plakobranchus ocellatus]